jgi:hypothetical protein
VSGGKAGGYVYRTAERLSPADATAPRATSWEARKGREVLISLH